MLLLSSLPPNDVLYYQQHTDEVWMLSCYMHVIIDVELIVAAY